ncbi:baseplate complex protein [Aeromonas aquatilis]
MSRTAMLTLDGEPIVMKSMRISASMQFQDKDNSGQTSSTSSSEQGEKAKELDVSGLVPFNDEQTLNRLFELAAAKQDGGQRHIYRVGSLLAKGVKVRQAKFAGRITANEQEGLLAWQVQFTLREHNSVPEKLEQRQPKPKVTVGQGAENASTANTASPTAATTEQEQLSSWERMVKWLDDKLGDVMA